MILGQVINQGEAVETEYPCVKRWQRYNTFALFSTANRAVLIAVDASHENDFVGKCADDCNDLNWVIVKDYEIVISSK